MPQRSTKKPTSKTSLKTKSLKPNATIKPGGTPTTATADAWNLLVKLAKNNQLFAYLTAAGDNEELKRTTNSLEGGINSQIKKLMYDHRGLRDEHQRIACDWWLYLHTHIHHDPVDIARAQHWGHTGLTTAHTLHAEEQTQLNGPDDGRPPTYDNAIDTEYNHSIGIRKGPMR